MERLEEVGTLLTEYIGCDSSSSGRCSLGNGMSVLHFGLLSVIHPESPGREAILSVLEDADAALAS